MFRRCFLFITRVQASGSRRGYLLILKDPGRAGSGNVLNISLHYLSRIRLHVLSHFVSMLVASIHINACRNAKALEHQVVILQPVSDVW